MRGRTLAGALAALAVASATTIPALASGGAQSAATHSVVLENIRFHPGTLSIKRGDTVQWLWQDKGTEHNVTGSGFKSKTMSQRLVQRALHQSGNLQLSLHDPRGRRDEGVDRGALMQGRVARGASLPHPRPAQPRAIFSLRS